MLFIDTSDVKEIKKYMGLGIVSGVTTNQKILLKDGQTSIKKTISEIIKVSHEFPINIELTKTDKSDDVLVKEAKEYFSFSEHIVIKIPMWGDGRGLRLVRALHTSGIKTNITCCMSVEQVILASNAESDYISLFFRRIADYNKSYNSACEIMRASRNYLDAFGLGSQLIAGSIRAPTDVVSCFVNGADIVTVPPKILEKMFKHPKTEETIKEFDNAWKELKGEKQTREK